MCRAYSEEYTGKRSTKAASRATSTLAGTMTEREWAMSDQAKVTATEGQAEDQVSIHCVSYRGTRDYLPEDQEVEAGVQRQSRSVYLYYSGLALTKAD